jgi:hypothetical protein
MLENTARGARNTADDPAEPLPLIARARSNLTRTPAQTASSGIAAPNFMFNPVREKPCGSLVAKPQGRRRYKGFESKCKRDLIRGRRILP